MTANESHDLDRPAPTPSTAVAFTEDKFENWREAVGFAPGFPQMRAMRRPAPTRDRFGSEEPTDDSPRFFLNQIHREKAIEIYEGLGGSARVVTTAPGHGATTLARYLYAKAEEDAIIRRSIPVLTSIEDYIGRPYDALAAEEAEFLVRHHGDALDERGFTSDPDELRDEADDAAQGIFGAVTAASCAARIEAAVRLGVVRSLLTRPWDRVLNPALYRDLLNIDVPDRLAFERRREELAPLLEEGSESQWRRIRELAPQLGRDDYQEIIRELNDAHGVRISLLLDLSATPMGRQYVNDEEGEHLALPYLDVLKEISKAIKNIEQKASNGPKPTLPSLLDKTYFLSDAAWGQFQADFGAQESQMIRFPAYRPVDVFAMLAHHYPPYQHPSGGRTEVLAAVIDSDYVDIRESTGISTEMVLLERQLRRDIGRGKQITYHRRKRADDAKMEQIDEHVSELKQRIDTLQDDVRRLVDGRTSP